MGKGIKIWLAIMGIVGGIGLLLWFTPTVPSGAANPIGGEKGSILSPNLFKGKTAYTYQIAKEIPDVLDSIYCYCHCQKHSGHKSLLSCYTDNHAAFCDICQDEAIIAYELYKEGKDVQTIKKMVDKRFAR
ncbi:MAG: hypothetical protein HY878_00660 [Deltaproteobacteria bacterium]|nr:hypothetical protein [Deltaproteobacteria bacterium]